MATTATKSKWIETVLNDPQYFHIVGSGVDAWVGKKYFLSTKSVQGTKIVEIEGEIDYITRPSRANMQPKVGRVAFAKMKDTFKVLIADEELSKKYILSTGFALIEPSIESRYLYQYFQSDAFTRQKNRYSEGSTQQAIAQGDFGNIHVSFPEDRSEQQRISDILRVLDQTIEKTEVLIKKYEHVRTGMMQDLFCRRTDKKFPAGWETKTLKDVCYLKSGSTPSRSVATYWSGNVPWVSAKDMKSFNLTDSQEHITEKALRAGYQTVPAGTILIVTRGMILAHTFPVGTAMRSLTFNQDLKGLICYESTDSKFLAYWLVAHSDIFLKAATFATHGTKKLDTPDIEDCAITLPLLNEQKAIANKLETLDELLNKEVAGLYKLQVLKKGLSADLLTPRK